MAKQTFTANQVLTAAQMNSLQANDYNWTVDTKTDSYVLVAGDAGKRIVMNAATAKTITVNTSIFTAGDTVWIHNINTGTCTVTAGTATVNTAGSLALAQWEGGALYFTSASSAIFFRGGGANYGVATGGTSSSITVSGQAYTLLTFTSTGTLTVTKSGLFDVLCVGGGGAGGGGAGGGGGGGGVTDGTIYLTANATVYIGAGGAGVANENGISGVGSFVGVAGANGGGGGSANNRNGLVGGSGGGASNTGAAGITGQGNTGGNGGGADLACGGGGGAGANGSNNASTANGGAGGAGEDISVWIGQSAGTTYRGGGGGGSSQRFTSGTGGAGGSGGGGAGGSVGTSTAPVAGTANQGGGGGGHYSTTGANGGSGIVYVRFKV